jgi:predicted ATPase/DNA-binding CsgD family transcriptional regulator
MTDPDSLSDDYPLEPLTWREEDILSLLADRMTDREIAQTLNISVETVKWYNKRLYSKLGVKNRREAPARARELGLLLPGDAGPTISTHNLPAQTTPFVGRQRELEELSDLLQSKDVRLVTVLAPGGMGKTRLAIKSAEQQSSHSVHGVFFVPLSVHGSEDHIASAIAESIGLRLQVGGKPKQQVLRYLGNKQTLLLLDSFEHALVGAGIVGEILNIAPGNKVLATSRERLSLSGETIYPLGGLDVPGTGISGSALETHGAVRLFIESARHVHPGFVVEPDDREAIAHICRLVDGMPLGIVLAAAWVRVLSPAEIAREISNDLDFLSADMHDVPKRQRSIRSVFASALRRLSDAPRTTFEKLSVCRGGFTLEAARMIATANLPTMQLLADRGMLRRTSTGRYEVHELLRQFAEERLQKSANFRSTSDAHSLFYAVLLFNMETELRSRRQAEALRKIEDDIENVQGAWHYALKQGQHATIAMMLPSMYYFFESRGWFEEGEAAFRRAARQFSSGATTDEQQLLLGRLLARQGVFAHRLGHYQQAAHALKTSLSVFAGTGAQAEIAFTLSFMADLARSLANYEASRQLSQKSLTLFRDVEDRWGIAGELHNLGVAAYHLGEFDKAREYFDESLAMSRELDDPYGIITSLIGIGVLAHDEGHYQEAEKFYAESLSISEALDDRYGIAASLINLGRVYYLSGDLKSARQCCQRGLVICRDLGDRWGTAASLINLGDIACRMESFQDSRAHFSEAARIVTELQSEPLGVEIVVGMAALLAATGKQESALELLTPILHRPPEDREVRNRASRLQARLLSNLDQETVIEIQARTSGRSVEPAIRQLLRLL